MIGHEAKRVKLEGMLCRAFFKGSENGLRGGFLVQIRFALIAADGDKMVALAAVEVCRETGVFAVDRHTERQDITHGNGPAGGKMEERTRRKAPV